MIKFDTTKGFLTICSSEADQQHINDGIILSFHGDVSCLRFILFWLLPELQIRGICKHTAPVKEKILHVSMFVEFNNLWLNQA
jgi:hypothetical protein